MRNGEGGGPWGNHGFPHAKRRAHRVQLAAHTYAFRHLPLDGALDSLAALGVGEVEVWLGHATAGPDAVVRALAERGLRAAAVSAGGFYDGDTDAPERAFALAEALAAPVVVACLAPHVVGRIAARVPASLTLCVENHWDQPLAGAGEVLEVLERTPRLAACLDTGHALLAGERAEVFAERLGARLQHVHLKDARLPTRLERVLGRRLRRRLLERPAPVHPGLGALDLPALQRALARAGFAGTVTAEYEGPDAGAALGSLIHDWQAVADASRRLGAEKR